MAMYNHRLALSFFLANAALAAVNGQATSPSLRGASRDLAADYPYTSLTSDEIELFNNAAFLSRAAYFVDSYNDETANCEDPDGNTMEFCEQYETGLDAVLISKYNDQCFVTFRGTRAAKGDTFLGIDLPPSSKNGYHMEADINQNFITNMITSDGQCRIRSGFYEAYNSVANFIKDELPLCKATCAGGCEVVLTGHSQGGAAALVAAMEWNMKDLFNDPYVVAIGAPPIVVVDGEFTVENCEKQLNLDKTFRINIGTNNGKKVECDPMAENAKKKGIVWSEFPVTPPGDPYSAIEYEDYFTYNTGQLGTTILFALNTVKGRYEVATSTGDATCDDSAGTVQDLGMSLEVPPLHDIESYISHLDYVKGHPNNVFDGFIVDSYCSQDWQCGDGLYCVDDACVAGIYHTYTHEPTSCINHFTLAGHKTYYLADYGGDMDAFLSDMANSCNKAKLCSAFQTDGSTGWLKTYLTQDNSSGFSQYKTDCYDGTTGQGLYWKPV